MVFKVNYFCLLILVIGVDIGKDVFYFVGFDVEGQFVLRQKIKCFVFIMIFEKFCVVWLGWRYV